LFEEYWKKFTAYGRICQISLPGRSLARGRVSVRSNFGLAGVKIQSEGQGRVAANFLAKPTPDFGKVPPEKEKATLFLGQMSYASFRSPPSCILIQGEYFYGISASNRLLKGELLPRRARIFLLNRCQRESIADCGLETDQRYLGKLERREKSGFRSR